MRGLGLRLQVFEGLSGIKQLAEDWRALFDDLSQPSYVQLWEWQYASLENAASNREVYFGALYDGKGLVAILPLECKTTRRLAGLNLPFGVRVASFPDAIGVFHHGDILLQPRIHPRFDLVAVLEEFRSRIPRPWDATRFGPVLEDSTVSTLFHASHTHRIHEVKFTETIGFSNALRTGNHEVFLGRLSKNFKGGLRKSRNKLAKLERVSVDWSCTQEALEAAFPQFLQVEASGWKGKSGTAIDFNPLAKGFYAGLLPSGRARINLLLHGNKAIAGQLGIVVGERYYLLKIGYDESYSQEAPGNLLLEHLLQKLAVDPSIRYIDLVTDQPWHASWQPARRRVLSHQVIHNISLGVTVLAAVKGKRLLRPLVQNLGLGSRSGIAQHNEPQKVDSKELPRLVD
jgi:hypothetical protein